jgi:hypothetical protein
MVKAVLIKAVQELFVCYYLSRLTPWLSFDFSLESLPHISSQGEIIDWLPYAQN